ncbi:MAG: homocysteine S-methyltransferase [bacterium]|nr:homocysteine S-methyltransferase [bacterium]
MNATKTVFADVLASGRKMLIDGGLSTQLEAQGCTLNSDLWTAELLLSQPQSIVDAHLAYLRAGAECIITASYQASLRGFESLGISEQKFEQFLKDSVDLALTATETFLQQDPKIARTPMVAASIGPYGAALADGSEYSGKYGISDEELVNFHKRRLTVLDQTDCHILACETIPCIQEARVLHDLLLSTRTDAWVCVSCKDGKHLNDGSSIASFAEMFAEHPKVLAIGINCTAPEYVVSLMHEIKQFNHAYIIVYPNLGEMYNAQTKSWSLKNDNYATTFEDSAMKWFEEGASIVGGCCRVNSEHIDAIHQNMAHKSIK